MVIDLLGNLIQQRKVGIKMGIESVIDHVNWREKDDLSEIGRQFVRHVTLIGPVPKVLRQHLWIGKVSTFAVEL